MDTLKDRVLQFNKGQLPGQPIASHMGTVYLVNDLWREVERLSGANDGAALIAQERKRQMDAEGWTPEHDDQHTHGELATAAACYLLYWRSEWTPLIWPWTADQWKQKDQLFSLVRAGALIAAEIDRLLRAQADQ